MLKDRISLTQSGFSIFRESGTDRTVSYGSYSLADDPETVPGKMQELSYWDPLDTAETKFIPASPCVVVVEREGDRPVESCRFISPRIRKPVLEITVRPAGRKYGKQAYVITIAWPDSPGERINSGYLFLAGPGGERYPFLKEVVEPIPGRRRAEDQFIYIVPKGDNPEQYHVAVLPVLRERYRVVM